MGGHWHTHNDTADKVSADSLQKIGYILESGLKTGSWLNIRVQENTESAEQEQVEDNDNEEHGETSDLEADEMFIGVLLICCTLLVWGNLAWLIFADNRGEG